MFLPLLLPRGDDSTGDITVPHTTILSALQRDYAIRVQEDEEVDSSIGGSGNVVKPGRGGKRFPSTLAGGNTADNTFAKIGGGVGKRPISTLSALAAFDVVNSNTRGYSGGKRFLSGYAAHRRPAKSAVFRPRLPCLVKPVGAITSSWSRLLARLPRKV